MAHGDFIWCDLSAYDPDRAMPFYERVLGWSFSEDGSTGHHLASVGSGLVGALYQMPQKFIDMGMPSFWMSYIAVDDAAATVEKARELGAIIELGPEQTPSGSRYALIRDPLGAGFTVMEGEPGSDMGARPGMRMGHALFVSEVARIQPFYTALFGWDFGASEAGVYPVHHNGAVLFQCHEIPDPAIRGKEQFWAVLFAQATDLSAIAQAGGRIAAEFDLPEGPAALAHDQDGAAFIVIKTGAVTSKAASIAASAGSSGLPWRGWAGLGLLFVSALTTHLWPWTIFLGIWVFEALRTGYTHLLQPIGRRSEPVLFWAIIATFTAFAVFSALYPFGYTP